LFNGVGGGARAVISWGGFPRFRFTYGGRPIGNARETSYPGPGVPTYVAIFSVFAAIVGSVSFWGSNIAFGKLQEILPGKPIKLPGQTIINGVLFAICVGSAIVLAAGVHSQALFIIGILFAAALLGNMVVLPIGGADMPV